MFSVFFCFLAASWRFSWNRLLRRITFGVPFFNGAVFAEVEGVLPTLISLSY